MCEMNSERRLFNLTGQVGTLQWKLDNMDTKKTCHSVRIIPDVRIPTNRHGYNVVSILTLKQRGRSVGTTDDCSKKAKEVKRLIRWLHYKGHGKKDVFCWTKENMSR